jgi:hypothetical protein
MGIGLGDSEVLEPELCQPISLFVADVVIGPSVGDRAIEADTPFRGRELGEEGSHEPIAQPRQRRLHGSAREHDRGEGRIQWGVAAGGVRPVDHDRATPGEHDVGRMEVEMEDRIALAAEEVRRRHRVQLAMEPGERQRVRSKAPGTAAQVREHRRPVDALERQVGAAHVDDARRGIPALAHVSHDRDLELGHRTAAVTAEDAGVVDREDVGVLPAREERTGQRASRWNSTILPCTQR